MKRRSGGSSALEPIDQLLEPQRRRRRRCTALVTRGGELVGGIGELGAEREQIALQRDELGVERRDRAP